MNIHNLENTCVCANMQSFFNIQCHLETFQALSTNFGDNPRTLISLSAMFIHNWKMGEIYTRGLVSLASLRMEVKDFLTYLSPYTPPAR